MAKNDKENKQSADDEILEEIEAEAVTGEEAPAAATSPEQRVAELADQNLRLRAEFDNYRKRTQKEREALYIDVRAECVKKLLPVMDNLERAAAAVCQDAAYAQGVEMTLKQCRELFGSLGVTPFGEAGEPFDPNLHDAVMHAEDDAYDKNTITEVLQTGYRLGDKILRHAMVRVAN